jgi:hypothetical protein
MTLDRPREPSTPRRRARPRALLVAPALAGLVALSLLLAACGGSPGSDVARLGSTTTQSASSSGASNTGGSPSSQVLAFSRCMRFHGVANFADPNSSGVLPKSQVAQLAVSNPRFPGAHRACEHLLPNSGQPAPAQVRQAWSDMRKFARCMRSHGVRNWPGPTVTSRQDNRPFFYVSVSVDPNSPQITIKINACQHVFHANNPLVTTQ